MHLLPLDMLGSPWLIVAIFSLVVLGAMVQAGLGMGFGLTAAPLLAMIDPVLVPVPALFMGMLSSVGTAFLGRRDIQWREVRVGVAGRLVGVTMAVWVLSLLTEPKTFMLVFGIVVGVAVILSLSGLRLPFSAPSLFCMGNLSGLMATITSIGAPPMALLYQDRLSYQARPTLCAIFALGGMGSLAGLYLSGWAGMDETVMAVLLLPPMALGVLIAKRYHRLFDKRYRPALLMVSSLSATLLIWRGLS